MTYGTKRLKNGKSTGYLIFDSGKRIFLKNTERIEFDRKLRFAEETGRLKERMK